MKQWVILGLAAGLSAVSGAPRALAATTCEGMVSAQAGQGVTITAAAPIDSLDTVAKGLESAHLAAPVCRVQGFVSPTTDSHITFEVWLPAPQAWNGKFNAVGNGGLFGFLNYRAILPAVNRNYAAMTTDLGHRNAPGQAEDPAWARGHPQKVIDYAWRAEHLSVLAAKAIVAAYYGSTPRHAYYTGCSAGGIQGMTELLRYPDDFDGYVIGDATPDHLGQEIGALWTTLEASLKDPAHALLPEQIALIHKQVLADCAGKDGGLASDAFLTDPRLCRFDPKELECRDAADHGTCLAPAQVAIVRRLYRGPVDPRTGEVLLAGITPGSEATWGRFFSGKTNPATTERPWGGFLQEMAYADPDYLAREKYLQFDFGKDVDILRRKAIAGETLDEGWNTRNRTLDAFIARGGKIIHYHGWDDPNIPAREAIRFHDSLIHAQMHDHGLTLAQATAALNGSYRLFMVAGLDHCTGGAGPWSFGQNGQAPLKPGAQYDTVAALDGWVEHGQAPDRFIGSHLDVKTGTADLTRPICAYPATARWSGQGNAADAANYACIPATRARDAVQ